MAHEAPAAKTANSVPEQRTAGPWPLAGGSLAEGLGGTIRPLPFDRLLSAAVLTPGQASFVAVRLLEAADRGAAGDGEPAGARLGAVTITPAGEVEVGPSQADEGTPVTELLSQLVHNARRLPAHPRPEQLLLLHRLEEVAAGAPVPGAGARARTLEGALKDALGSGYRQRLSGQFAALVAAFAHVAPSVPAAVDGVAGSLPMGGANHRAAVVTPGSSRGPSRRAARGRAAASRPPDRARGLIHRRARRRRVALVVLVLAAVLAGGGYVLLGGPGVGIVGSLARGNHPAGPTTTAPPQHSKQPAKHQRSPRHQPRAVPALAARHAGPVAGVQVQKISACKPGARCTVKVKVHLRPASTARAVGWKVGAVRLCKHGITWSPVTTVTAHAGWTTVFARSPVRVPQGRSLALTAVTTTPARAQSPPVPVTGSARHC